MGKGLLDSYSMRSVWQVPAGEGSQPVDHYIYLHPECTLSVKNRVREGDKGNDGDG